MPPRRTAAGRNGSGPGRPGRRGPGAGGGDGRGKPPTVAQLHAEWLGPAPPGRPVHRHPGAHRGVPAVPGHGAGRHPGQGQASLGRSPGGSRTCSLPPGPSWSSPICSATRPPCSPRAAPSPRTCAPADPGRPTASGCGRLRPGRSGRPGGTAAHLPAGRRYATDRGVQGGAVPGRAGRGPVPPPRHPAGPADQRRAVGPGARHVRRARDDRRVRRGPVAGRTRPAARLRQPARRPPGAAAAEERRRRAQHEPGRVVRAQRRGPGRRSPTLSAPRSARRSNCWSASCPGWTGRAAACYSARSSRARCTGAR